MRSSLDFKPFLRVAVFGWCAVVALGGCELVAWQEAVPAEMAQRFVEPPPPQPTPVAQDVPRPTVAISGELAPPAGPSEALVTQMLNAINLRRASVGLDAVVIEPRLQRAAQDYADVLARAGRLGHSGIDGTDLSERAFGAGYRFGHINENLSLGYPGPAQAVDGWMDSPGHRRNLLSDQIVHVGLGRAVGVVDGRPSVFWVMVGGRPLQ